MYNTIILYKGEAELTKFEKNFEKGGTTSGYFGYCEEIGRWSIEEKEEAMQELKKYNCTYNIGYPLSYVEEYILEFCETDEDGDIVDGSDIVFADPVYNFITPKEEISLLSKSKRDEMFRTINSYELVRDTDELFSMIYDLELEFEEA